MSRGLSAANEAAVNNQVVRRVYFAFLDYKNAPAFFCSAAKDIAFDYDGSGSDTNFVGIGALGSISELEEGTDIQSYAVDLSITGLEDIDISIALSDQYKGRDAIIWRGFLDEDHLLIDAPDVAFSGRMSLQEIDFENGAIALTVISRLADWQRANNSRYTNEEQQRRYPGDKGLEFIAQQVEKQIVWGA